MPHAFSRDPASGSARSRYPLPMRVIVGWLLCAVAVGNAAGQDRPGGEYYFEHGFLAPQPLPGGNAAVEWFELWRTFKTSEWNRLGREVHDYRVGAPPTPENEKLLRENQQFLNGAGRIAAIQQCEWGLLVPDGYAGRPFPVQLIFGRPTHYLLMMDAQRCFSEGRMVTGVDRLVAAIRIARQLSLQGDVGVVTQAARACAESCEAIGKLIEEKRLEPAHARRLLGALREFPAVDPFSVGGAFEADAGHFLHWLRTTHTGDYPVEQFVRTHEWLLPDSNPGAAVIRWFTQDRFHADLLRLERYYAMLAQAARSPDADLALELLDLEAREGQHGIMAKLGRPAFSIYIGGLMPPFALARRLAIARLERVIDEAERTPREP